MSWLGCSCAPATPPTKAIRDSPPPAVASVTAAQSSVTPAPSQADGPPSPPSSASTPGSSPIDALFRSFEKGLPKPASLGEANGFSMECKHGGATFGHLDAIAAKVPLDGDASVPALVRWARHDDPCIRDIAVKTILRVVAFDKNQLVEPPMHETDHFLYRAILAAAMNRLAADGAPLDPIVVAGLDLAISDADFGPLLAGKWEENRGERSFQLVLTVEPGRLAFTQIDVPPDPSFPDTTWTVPIASAKLDARRAFLVTGASRSESNTKGFVGAPQKPDAPFVLIPAGGGVLWFDQGFGSFVKLHRVK